MAAAALDHRESHWVAKPGMNALAKAWAAPIGEHIQLETRVDRIERDALHKHRWQLRTEGGSAGVAVHGAFDAVVLAIPHPQAQALLQAMPHGGGLAKALNTVSVHPCWTLMLQAAGWSLNLIDSPQPQASVTLGLLNLNPLSSSEVA